MNIQNLKIFDKKGYDLNLNFEGYIEIIFESEKGYGAKAYGIVDKNNHLTNALIISSGYNYDEQKTSCYLLINKQTKIHLSKDQYTILFKDVKISNTNNYDITYTKGIQSITFQNISQLFSFPSISAAGAIYYNPVSIGLVETETLFIMEKDIETEKIITPYSDNSGLYFEFNEGDEEIR